MQTAVPASCCAKMSVADRAAWTCELGWRVASVAAFCVGVLVLGV